MEVFHDSMAPMSPPHWWLNSLMSEWTLTLQIQQCLGQELPHSDIPRSTSWRSSYLPYWTPEFVYSGESHAPTKREPCSQMWGMKCSSTFCLSLESCSSAAVFLDCNRSRSTCTRCNNSLAYRTQAKESPFLALTSCQILGFLVSPAILDQSKFGISPSPRPYRYQYV